MMFGYADSGDETPWDPRADIDHAYAIGDMKVENLSKILSTACRYLEGKTVSANEKQALDDWWAARQVIEARWELERHAEQAMENAARRLYETKPVGQMTRDERTLLEKYRLI